MPKAGGSDYYAVYFNINAPANRRDSKVDRKPSSADIVDFIKESLQQFETKYGIKAKLILMNNEAKEILDSRTKGKKFLNKIIIKVDPNMGVNTIYLHEGKKGL